MVEVRPFGQGLEREGNCYHENCKHDGNRGAIKASRKLSSNYLYAVLQVYPGNIKSKGIARKKGDIFQEITPYRSDR